VTARPGGRFVACGGCELGRAGRHLERAAGELEQARLSWGVWADGVRQRAERRLGVSAAGGFAVLEDPEYARALRLGAWFDDAIEAAGAALAAAGDGSAGSSGVCRRVLAGQQ
jgi:hypothetical protein